MRLPRHALTNFDIMKHARDVPYFRGVYMRTSLPRKPWDIESGIVNLDSAENSGTHWVAYVKFYEYCEYFDSYGDLKPPLELIDYLGCKNIFYNYKNYQNFNTVICGHLCLKFLKKFWRNVI